MKNPWKTKAAKRKSWSVNAVQKKAALRIARGEADMTADPDEFRRGRIIALNFK